MKHKLCYALPGLLLPGYAAAQTQMPNIVIIMTDQQRADLCGREGFPLDITPYVDSIASENAWFDKAYTSMPASSPARCSMLTGRYPSATAVRTNHNIADMRYGTDIVKTLKEKGYQTALVGKNHAYLKPKDMDHWSEYGHWGKSNPQTASEKATTEFFKNARGQWLKPSPIALENQQPVKIVSEALDWIDAQNGNGNPFFLWMSFPEPHNPYQVCEPYYSMFAPDKLPAPRTDHSALKYKDPSYSILAELEDKSCPNLSADLPRLRGNYMGMIRLIDDQIRRLMETMKANGTYDNTIFLILSDHGDYCGEYGLIRKGAGLPDCLARIPMVWAGYGISKHNAPVDAHVSIADIFPTLCTAVGADIPVGVQGRSLWPMLTGESYPQDEFSSILVQRGYGGENVTDEAELTFEAEGALGKGVANFDELNSWTQSGTSRMLRKGDWKLIIDSHGNGELYNIMSDPSEISNLFYSADNEKKKLELMSDMLKWELRLQDPLPVPRRRYKFEQNQYNYQDAESYIRDQSLNLYIGDGDWESRSLTLAPSDEQHRKEYKDGELPVGYSTILFNDDDLPLQVSGNPAPVVYLNGEKYAPAAEPAGQYEELDHIKPGDVVKMFPKEPASYDVTYNIASNADVTIVHDRTFTIDNPSVHSVLEGTESRITPSGHSEVSIKANSSDVTKNADGRYVINITSPTSIEITASQAGSDVISADTFDPATPVYNIQGIPAGTTATIRRLPAGVYISKGQKIKI